MNLTYSISYALLLFVGMLIFAEAGRWLARWRARSDFEGAWHGVGVVDGAIFGLLGLLIAFTFSGAASRFEVRRNQIVEETNAIGTAYLRIDLVRAEDQTALRDGFRRYLDSRIETYRRFPDIEAVKAEVGNTARLQSELWTQALAAVQGSQPATMLLIPALNEMFDIATTRTVMLRMHPPPVIFMMLFGLALVGSLLAGYSTAKAESRAWLHSLGFAAITSFAFYVIVDLEYPRLGAIQVNALDEALVNLRNQMN